MAKAADATTEETGTPSNPLDKLQFGGSPFPFAQTITDEEKRREAARREELRKAREATNPHFSHNRQGRPDRLALPEAFVRDLEQRQLMPGWIRKDEWPEYQTRGAVQATHEMIANATGGDGSLRHDSDRDPIQSSSGAIERGDAMLIIQPKQWQADRMKQEQFMAKTQMAEDPFDELPGMRRKGEFGKGARQPDALVFSNEQDEDDD